MHTAPEVGQGSINRIGPASAARADRGERLRGIQRVARTTGLLYLAIVVIGMFSPIVLESTVVPGDAAATTEGVLGSQALFTAGLVGWIAIVILDAAIAVALYAMLRPAGRGLSMLAAALRLVYAAILGAFVLDLVDGYELLTGAERASGAVPQDVAAMALSAFERFDTGFLVALVAFGAHLLALGAVLLRSRFVPRAIGIVLVAAGAGYVADSLLGLLTTSHGGVVSAILLAPSLLGEIGLTGWLLIKGVATSERSAR